ncbi:hypothetical protein LIER_22140 [Lithospermum erythrorhizon]|uniref:Uncharacterized protein n=1 Tax=Lithospermum erythrorhizon TaxID=34254 RepID=A0AAV3QVS7_LITER
MREATLREGADVVENVEDPPRRSPLAGMISEGKPSKHPSSREKKRVSGKCGKEDRCLPEKRNGHRKR